MNRRGYSLLELVVIVCVLAIFVAILLPAIARAGESARRGDCAHRLKQLGLACSMRAKDSPEGLYPPMQVGQVDLYDRESGEPTGSKGFVMLPMARMDALYPQYVDSPDTFVCPASLDENRRLLFDSDGNWLGDRAYDGGAGRIDRERGIGLVADSYLYFGWALDQCGHIGRLDSLSILGGPESVSAPAQLVSGLGPVLDEMRRTEADTLAEGDIVVPGGLGTNGSLCISRLREGVERFAVTDINHVPAVAKSKGDIWVMSDMFDSSSVAGLSDAAGANVLFMDGHVEFVKYPGKAPATPGMAAFVEAIGHLCSPEL